MFDKAAAAFERRNTQQESILQIMKDCVFFESTRKEARLTKQQIIDAMHLGASAFYSDRGTDAKKQYLRTAGKALMQLWHDLEEEERVSVGQKVLA
ncbi:hypothetical protein [Acetobacter pasteurianus]|uniref:hypothetical protein n=1 Tax=Acetobacter pasteurianus TaxID=438 RepID=UPI002490A48B|nr:hypothetical protein [Acetobacter pasteurianus]